MKSLKAYIAGPDVFRANAKEHFNEIRKMCAEQLIEPLIPLDNDIGDVTGRTLDQISEAIFRGNVAMIKKCDVVIANVTSFRGPSLDPGTAYEIGMAFALGKPIVCYVSDGSDYDPDFEIRSLGHESAEFPIIEEFTQFDNLMISRSSMIPNHFFRDLRSALEYANTSLSQKIAA